MYYGYVGGGIKTVVTDFNVIRELQIKHPYSSFRKFYKEEKAWNWVKYRSSIKGVSKVTRYGDTFADTYVTMEYFIYGDAAYYNFRTPNIGDIFLTTSEPNVFIENRKDVIKVKISKFNASDTILGHLSAIYQGLNVLGPYVDVEIVVPDHSIFYSLTQYTGTDSRINRVLNLLKSRIANFSVTLDDF